MGILEAVLGSLFGEVIQGISLFQSVIELVIIGGFIYFILTRYWWKPKPAEKDKK